MNSLPYSVKRNCSAQLVKLNRILRRNAQVRAETGPGRRRVLARMFLDDDRGNLFTLELFCGSQEQANHRLAEASRRAGAPDLQ